MPLTFVQPTQHLILQVAKGLGGGVQHVHRLGTLEDAAVTAHHGGRLQTRHLLQRLGPFEHVALHQAFDHLKTIGAIKEIPLRDQVAAVSCGLWRGEAILDLDYAEDSTAEADSNFVFTATGGIVEVQGTAEAEPFSQEQFDQLMVLARKGTDELAVAQRAALGL